MNFDLLLYAPFAVQLHVAAALCAIVLGPLVLWRRSRDRWHKGLGRAWVGAMAVTALSSFAISAAPVLGPFGPIHALSVFTIWGLWQGVKAARQGRIQRHQREMRSLYFWAMGVAGVFTFLPGRRMNIIFFDAAPMAGFIAVAGVIGTGLAWYAYRSRRAGGAVGAA